METAEPLSPLFERVVDLFLAGKLPKMNHARHIAVAQILKHVPHGRELMHLGLQVTATRKGVPEKYSADITEAYWAQISDAWPNPGSFADVP